MFAEPRIAISLPEGTQRRVLKDTYYALRDYYLTAIDGRNGPQHLDAAFDTLSTFAKKLSPDWQKVSPIDLRCPAEGFESVHYFANRLLFAPAGLFIQRSMVGGLRLDTFSVTDSTYRAAHSVFELHLAPVEDFGQPCDDFRGYANGRIIAVDKGALIESGRYLIEMLGSDSSYSSNLSSFSAPLQDAANRCESDLCYAIGEGPTMEIHRATIERIRRARTHPDQEYVRPEDRIRFLLKTGSASWHRLHDAQAGIERFMNAVRIGQTYDEMTGAINFADSELRRGRPEAARFSLILTCLDAECDFLGSQLEGFNLLRTRKADLAEAIFPDEQAKQELLRAASIPGTEGALGILKIFRFARERMFANIDSDV